MPLFTVIPHPQPIASMGWHHLAYITMTSANNHFAPNTNSSSHVWNGVKTNCCVPLLTDASKMNKCNGSIRFC